jgi:hypothetical protein
MCGWVWRKAVDACPTCVPACLQEHVLDAATRRKLSVHIEGSRTDAASATASPDGGAVVGAGDAAPAAEGSGSGAPAASGAATAADVAAEQAEPGAGTKSADGTESAAPATAAAAGPAVQVISDMYAFRRRQQLYGTCK